MMAIVKDLFSNSGRKSDYAKRFGVESAADLAKRVRIGGADLAKRVGGGSADIAKKVSGSAADIAKQVGARRALIGFAVIGAAIGGIVLVRYLRARADEAEDLEANEEPGTAAGRRNRRRSRAKRRADMANTVTH